MDRTERGAVLATVTGSEAHLVDASGEVWTFVGDAPSIPCTIIRDEMVDGILLVHIETDVPSVDGVSRFRVLRAMVP
jgi:hypothetical protein